MSPCSFAHPWPEGFKSCRETKERALMPITVDPMPMIAISADGKESGFNGRRMRTVNGPCGCEKVRDASAVDQRTGRIFQNRLQAS